jgi:hypothetical protein
MGVALFDEKIHHEMREGKTAKSAVDRKSFFLSLP